MRLSAAHDVSVTRRGALRQTCCLTDARFVSTWHFLDLPSALKSQQVQSTRSK